MGFLDSVRSFLDKQEDKIERQQVLEAAAEEATPQRLQESTLSKAKRVAGKKARRLGLDQETFDNVKDTVSGTGQSLQDLDQGGRSDLPTGDPEFAQNTNDAGGEDLFAQDNDELFSNDDLNL